MSSSTLLHLEQILNSLRAAEANRAETSGRNIETNINHHQQQQNNSSSLSINLENNNNNTQRQNETNNNNNNPTIILLNSSNSNSQKTIMNAKKSNTKYKKIKQKNNIGLNSAGENEKIKKMKSEIRGAKLTNKLQNKSIQELGVDPEDERIFRTLKIRRIEDDETFFLTIGVDKISIEKAIEHIFPYGISQIISNFSTTELNLMIKPNETIYSSPHEREITLSSTSMNIVSVSKKINIWKRFPILKKIQNLRKFMELINIPLTQRHDLLDYSWPEFRKISAKQRVYKHYGYRKEFLKELLIGNLEFDLEKITELETNLEQMFDMFYWTYEYLISIQEQFQAPGADCYALANNWCAEIKKERKILGTYTQILSFIRFEKNTILDKNGRFLEKKIIFLKESVLLEREKRKGLKRKKIHISCSPSSPGNDEIESPSERRKGGGGLKNSKKLRKIECPICGKSFSQSRWKKHLNSKKHFTNVMRTND